MGIVSDILSFKKRTVIISGHYGSGKSQISVELSLALAKHSEKVSLCDLDIVNPYFRSADSKELLRRAGVRVIASEYANTNVDIPTVPAEVSSVFTEDGYALLDVGGDETGARVLGFFADKIREYGYSHFCVVNFLRPLTRNAEDAAEYIKAIAASSSLDVTAIINNTNLGADTSENDLVSSFSEADRLSHITGLPLYSSFIGDGRFDREVFMMQDRTKKYF